MHPQRDPNVRDEVLLGVWEAAGPAVALNVKGRNQKRGDGFNVLPDGDNELL
jgi:hypothetical protein